MTKIDGGLSGEFRKHLPGFHFQSIETGGTGRGIPDTNYACEFCAGKSHSTLIYGAFVGVEGWIEYKTTDGWVLGLRPEQVGWIARRARMGCRVWVAVRRQHRGGKRRGAACDELWLVPGRHVIQVQDAGLRGLDGPAGALVGVRVWYGGPARWDWTAVRDLLLR